MGSVLIDQSINLCISLSITSCLYYIVSLLTCKHGPAHTHGGQHAAYPRTHTHTSARAHTKRKKKKKKNKKNKNTQPPHPRRAGPAPRVTAPLSPPPLKNTRRSTHGCTCPVPSLGARRPRHGERRAPARTTALFFFLFLFIRFFLLLNTFWP